MRGAFNLCTMFSFGDKPGRMREQLPFRSDHGAESRLFVRPVLGFGGAFPVHLSFVLAMPGDIMILEVDAPLFSIIVLF